jgi:poly-gamma-glutamate synthase PgsB/CapB
LAKKLKARALVAECMAIKPELQWISENQILRSSIGVITNARMDHVEEMGDSLEKIAASLGNTMSRQGVLFTADPLVAKTLETRAKTRGTIIELVQALDPQDIDAAASLYLAGTALSRWWLADAGLALAVAGHCGVKREIALRGIAKARPDPGAARFVEIGNGLKALDASAANDPESLLDIVNSMIGHEKELLFVYNNRQDRLPRLMSFLSAGLPGTILVTGANPGLLLSRRSGVRKGSQPSDQALFSKRSGKPSYVPSLRLSMELQRILTEETAASGKTPRLVLCGNTKGWPVDLYGSL